MPRVFLSYRRRDTEGEAGRLGDVLQLKLGQKLVFRDVVSISPGEQFDAALDSRLAAAKVVVVLIGQTWLEELKRRLTLGDIDYHRMEVATALTARKRVIPVLLRNAVLPPAAALPDDIQALTKCQAITVRDEAWSTDVERLINAIGRPYRWDLLILRCIFTTIAIPLAVWTCAPYVAPQQASNYDFWRGFVLALLGLYGITELFVGFRDFQRLGRNR